MQKVTTKEALDKFKPDRPVFVISVDSGGKPSGMVANWHMRCSAEPPLFAVSLSKKGHTYKLIQQSKEFVIAVPNKDLVAEIEFFGSNHGDKVDKFQETQIETAPAKLIKPPLIKNATINFECKLESETDAGDHIIFIGEIIASHLDEDRKILLDTGKVDGKRIFEEF